jgi:sulfide:quinone oxidoreductase
LAAKRIVVLGSGPGGLAFARAARRLLGGTAEIVIVERSRRIVFKPLLTLIAAGLRRPEDAYVSLEGLHRLGVKPVWGESERVDVGDRAVVLRGGERLSYDYLVVAVGAEPREDAVPGLREANLNPWTMEGALRLREALASKPGRVVAGAVSMPYPCPPAPFEMAGLAKKAGAVSVTMLFPEEKPLPRLGPEVSSKLESLIESSGVEFRGGSRIAEVDPKARRVVLEGGESIGFDVLALVPPFRPPRMLVESGLAPEGGWPAVDPFKGFRHARHDDVFVVGDTASPALGAPMAGFLASHMAEEAARAIAADVRGGDRGEPAPAKASCFLDLIDDGAAIFCDFTEVIYSGGKPHCHVVAEGPLAGRFKEAFERHWKENVAPPP